ncbi:MAG: isochorismatase family cysteine hydrolase, partial [Mycobacteriaceae bacterium]
MTATASGLAAAFGGQDRQAGRGLDRVRLMVSGTGAPTLVAIDLQNVFASPSSGFFTPKFADAAAVIEHMIPVFGDRVIFTRFVAPAHPVGAWVSFYEEWPFALVAESDPIYDLVAPFGESARATVTETTFRKWGAGLERALGDSSEMVLAGIATDFCVLSTALAAADAGVRVSVVADACAGSTDANHQLALDVMALYGPLITITDSASVLARL